MTFAGRRHDEMFAAAAGAQERVPPAWRAAILAAGAQERVPPVQDVYSFAAMAYECLAGKPPFSRGNIEYQIMNTAPAPLPPGGSRSCATARGDSPSFRVTAARATTAVSSGNLFVLSKGSPNSERSERRRVARATV